MEGAGEDVLLPSSAVDVVKVNWFPGLAIARLADDLYFCGERGIYMKMPQWYSAIDFRLSGLNHILLVLGITLTQK